MRGFLLALLVGTMVLASAAPAMARHAPSSAKANKAAVTAAQPAKQGPDLRIGLAAGQGSVTISPAAGKGMARTDAGKSVSLAAGSRMMCAGRMAPSSSAARSCAARS